MAPGHPALALNNFPRAAFSGCGWGLFLNAVFFAPSTTSGNDLKSDRRCRLLAERTGRF